MVLYEAAEDPSIKAIADGEVYLMFGPALFYVTGGLVTACGAVVLARLRGRAKAERDQRPT